MSNFYLYADENSLFEIVSDKQKVLLVGGDFGYGNFGDVAQLKGTVDFYQKNTKLEAIVVYNIDSISNVDFIEKRKKQLNVKSILFISDNYLSFNDSFSLSLIEQTQNFSLIHLYGGGFLNSMWGDYILDVVEFFIDNLNLKNYVISGQQIEDKIIPRLIKHVSKYQPTFFGVRDYDSLRYLELAGIEGIYSFDDAFEQLFKIAQKVDNKKQNRILAHFNISSYTGSEDKLYYFNNLLNGLKMYDNPKLTMFNAYDDKRFEVSDTISVLKEFEDEFVYESYEIVHGTKLLYDTYNDESYNCLSVKLAISSSYHTTMLMQLCGTPCWLISNNSYYDQKREALEVRQTFEEFIKEPFLPSFDDRIQKRVYFYIKLQEFLNSLPELASKNYFTYKQKDAFKFSFKVNLVDEKSYIQELIKTKDWLISDNGNKEQYIQELIKTKDWLISDNENKEQYIQELIKTKDWLISDNENKEQYIQELIKTKDWLISDNENKEQYIQELIKTKDWLISDNENKEQYIQELIKTKDRLISDNENKEQYIQELIKTKDWLISDNENKEQYIQELIKTKDWLISDNENKEQYIQELIKTKDWLISDNENKEQYIQELIKTKDWLISDNENKEQYIQELIKTKEYLLSEEIKYNEVKKTLFYKIGRKLGFFTNKN